MFDSKELKEIDTDYFHLLQITGYHIIIKSKNTGHIWDIYSKDGDEHRSLSISHKHNDSYPFHVQAGMHPKTLSEAQELIKKHDEYHIKERSISRH